MCAWMKQRPAAALIEINTSKKYAAPSPDTCAARRWCCGSPHDRRAPRPPHHDRSGARRGAGARRRCCSLCGASATEARGPAPNKRSLARSLARSRLVLYPPRADSRMFARPRRRSTSTTGTRQATREEAQGGRPCRAPRARATARHCTLSRSLAPQHCRSCSSLLSALTLPASSPQITSAQETEETKWEDPEPTALGWIASVDHASEIEYFHNVFDGTSQWEQPEDPELVWRAAAHDDRGEL